MKSYAKLVVIMALAMSTSALAASSAREGFVKSVGESAAKSAKDLVGKPARDIMANQSFREMGEKVGLSSAMQMRLAQAASEGKTHLVEAFYASVAAKQMIEANQAAEGLDSSIANVMKAAALSGKGAVKSGADSLNMTASERESVSAALKRHSEFTVDMLGWSKADAETHIKVANRMGEIFNGRKVTAEEALLQAIMEVVTNGDRTAAMKIIEKMKDCV